jgi:hypothetical protein
MTIRAMRESGVTAQAVIDRALRAAKEPQAPLPR